ncbi:MAG TPA: sugar phosphate nucleotidyltransferase [Thermoanaerobaculia bacterium]|jgi:mannose-1-phosphate guanylyltransferase
MKVAEALSRVDRRPSGVDKGRLWSVILAGGEGRRLRPLVERIHADGRPKQFAVLLGSRSLLRQTLDRIGLAIPPERTVVVATRAHRRFFGREFSGLGIARLLVQPVDRGTAAGILLPARWIAGRDPEATVAFFPSDHYIREDAAFMRRILQIAELADRHPRRVFLVGARPDSPETDYGWIEPGEELGDPDVRRVTRFWEKPSADMAASCFERGCLWNTFVLVGKVAAILEAGRAALPSVHEALLQVLPTSDPDFEAQSIERAYSSLPTANFSSDVLAALPGRLAVCALPPLTWSDWGTPERVMETLRQEGLAPIGFEQRAPALALAGAAAAPFTSAPRLPISSGAACGAPAPR